MKVILRADMDNLGERDEVVEVTDGYARNYLLPKGMAVQATESNLKDLEERRKVKERRKEREREKARELLDKFDEQTVTIKAKTGDSDRLFGSITDSDIIQALKETTGVELERKQLDLEENIRELGMHRVPIVLFEGVNATVNVNVVED